MLIPAQAGQAPPLRPEGRFRARQAGESWENVHTAGEGMDILALGLSGQGDQQWNPHDRFGDQGSHVPDLTALEKLPVIGSDRYDTIVQYAGGFQIVEQARDLGIPGCKVLIVAQAIGVDFVQRSARVGDRMDRFIGRIPAIVEVSGVFPFGRVRVVRREKVEVSQRGRGKLPDFRYRPIDYFVNQERAAPGGGNSIIVFPKILFAEISILADPE